MPGSQIDRGEEVPEAVLRRAQKGEVGARRLFVAYYQERVFLALWRQLGAEGRDRIEPIACQSFVEAFGTLASFSQLGPARVSPWLLSIARRRAGDEFPEALAGAGQEAPGGSPVPGDDFAEDVVAAASASANGDGATVGKRSRRPMARWQIWVIVIGIAAIVAISWRIRSSRNSQHSGRAKVAVREAYDLAPRTVAVAEPGSEFSWTGTERNLVVAQSAGDVFYRVAKGTRLSLETPYGVVQGTGSCFRVQLGKHGPWPAVAGTPGQGASFVIYEGTMHFADKHGYQKTLGAGHEVRAGNDGRVVGGQGPRPQPRP